MRDSRFEQDTCVRALDGTTFDARVDGGWWILRGPNGGYLAAIMLRAFGAVVDDHARAPRSLSLHFTAPPEQGPVRIETRIERTGRSLTTVSGRMTQGERLCVAAIAAFSKHRDAPEFEDARMPRVPSPDQCESLAAKPGPGVAMRDRYDQRVVPAHLLADDVQAVSGGWTRFAEPCLADAAAVAAFCDGWPPAIHARHGPDGVPMRLGVPTVDLTVHFRRALPLAETAADDFYLCVFRTRMAMEGFLEEDGEIWARDGRLLAHSRQLGVLA